MPSPCTVLLAAVALQAAPAPAAAVAAPTAPRPVAAAADTACVVTFERFYRDVAAWHPVVRQARLVEEQARAELQVARGAWDPTVTASLSSKAFGGKEYYDYAEAALKIPTPIGADIKLGYERGVGENSALDRRTPGSGLVTAGLSIPLGQRILTDERRAALRQAQALREVAVADRRAMVNRLLLGAARDYARWYEAWRRREVAAEGVALATFRLAAVRERVAAGEAAPVDTVEALLEVQRREVTRLEAEAGWYAASLAVAVYLWDERGLPVPLPDDARPAVAGLEPEPLDSAALPGWLARAMRQHPDLRRVAGRIRASEAQRLLAAQQVLPFVELELNALSSRDEAGDLLPPDGGLDDDGKRALTVRSPLLFLRERGRFGAQANRLESQRLEEDVLRREVENRVRVATNELFTIDRLIALQRVAVAQSRQLRDAEQRRFEAGESSLLVVNLRERQVLDEALRLASLEARWASARAELAVAVGEPASLPR